MKLISKLEHMLCFLLVMMLLAACAGNSASQSGEETSSEQQAEPDTPDLAKFEEQIRAFEEADQAEMPPEGSILFVGSSSVRMWKGMAADLAPLSVINRGFGGSTMLHLNYNAERIVKPYKPSCIVVYEGDNDITAADKTPESVIEDMKSFMSMVRDWYPDVTVYFLAVKPSVKRANLLPKAKRTNALISAYATETEGIEYLDIATPMMATPDSVRPDLFIEDNLHMNPKGYAIWTEAIKPILEANCGS